MERPPSPPEPPSERPPTAAGATSAEARAAAEATQEADQSAWQTAASWSGVGLEFGAGVVAFFLLGSWLDATWGTHPWMRVAGAFLGIVSGTYLLIKKALASGRADGPDRPQRRD